MPSYQQAEFSHWKAYVVELQKLYPEADLKQSLEHLSVAESALSSLDSKSRDQREVFAVTLTRAVQFANRDALKVSIDRFVKASDHRISKELRKRITNLATEMSEVKMPSRQVRGFLTECGEALRIALPDDRTKRIERLADASDKQVNNLLASTATNDEAFTASLGQVVELLEKKQQEKLAVEEAPKEQSGRFVDPESPAFVPQEVSMSRVKTGRKVASKVPVRGVPVSGVGSKAAVSKANRGKKG